MTSCKAQQGSFLTLNKRSAWGRGLQVNLDTSGDRLAVRREYEHTLDTETTLEELFGGVTVTDFAVGPCHLLYILGAEQRGDRKVPGLWVYDSSQKTVEQLACTGALLSQPTSITYTPGTLYVADAVARQRVVALAEINWQIRWAVDAAANPSTQGLDSTKTLTPADLAVSAEGELYALDGGNKAIVKFDVAGRQAALFGQDELAAARPRKLALSNEGYLYVLDPEAKRVWKFDLSVVGKGEGDDPLVSGDLIDFDGLITGQKLPQKFQPSGFAVDSHGRIYIGERRSVASTEEDDRFLRRFDAEGQYLGEAGDFRGSALELVLDSEDWIYAYGEEEAERKISVLKPTLRYTRLAGSSLVKGRYFSRSLDSAEEGTEWHKFVLDAELPANTQVQISYRAADDKQVTVRGSTANLDRYIEEAANLEEEERAQRAADLDALDWSVPAVNAGDALVLDNVGRYLWLRVDLIGGEEAAPSIGSLRLDFPRDTYLRYLPAVYQEDAQSRGFLERFLSLFETFFSETEESIGHLARYFDVDSSLATGDFLRWLASWLSISEDKSWSEEQLRELVRRAPELYRQRGTRDGLEAMIEIFTGTRPLVVEHFQTTGCAQSAAAKRGTDEGGGQRVQSLEEIYRNLYGTDPYCFCVLLWPYRTETRGEKKIVRRLSEEERKAVRRIVDAEKPAHTCAGLLALQPWINLDMHTYLEVNTYLSQPSARLELNSAIPRDTVLDDRNEAGQLERRSRLNVDITLT
ncbi:MAG: phage tail protein [Pyrinomonadaceae bacterium]